MMAEKKYKVLIENLETGEVEFDMETNAVLISCAGDKIEDDQEAITNSLCNGTMMDFAAAIYGAEKIAEKNKAELFEKLDKIMGEKHEKASENLS